MKIYRPFFFIWLFALFYLASIAAEEEVVLPNGTPKSDSMKEKMRDIVLSANSAVDLWYNLENLYKESEKSEVSHQLPFADTWHRNINSIYKTDCNPKARVNTTILNELLRKGGNDLAGKV